MFFNKKCQNKCISISHTIHNNLFEAAHRFRGWPRSWCQPNTGAGLEDGSTGPGVNPGSTGAGLEPGASGSGLALGSWEPCLGQGGGLSLETGATSASLVPGFTGMGLVLGCVVKSGAHLTLLLLWVGCLSMHALLGLGGRMT